MVGKMDANKCMKYVKILAALIMLVISVVMIVNIHFRKASFNLSGIIDSEDMDDLRLSIYLVNALIFKEGYWSMDDLIYIVDDNMYGVNPRKIIVEGRALKENIDALKQINGSHYQPVVLGSYLDARICYVLESKKNGKLFDVAMWGGYDWLSELFDIATGYRFDAPIWYNEPTIFANGIEVRDNAVFYRAILPFLPEDEAGAFKDIIQEMENR